MENGKEIKALPFTLREDTRYRFDYLPLYENRDVFQSIALYQVGDLCSKPGFSIGQHVQHYHEVCYIASGSGKFCINGKWFKVKAGDLVIASCGDTHDMVTNDDDPMRIYYLEFYIQPSAKEQAPYCDILALFENATMRNHTCHDQRSIAPMFTGIFQEMTSQGHFYGTIIESYSLQLLVGVFRAFASELQAPSSLFEAKNSLAHEIIHYLDANIENISNLYKLTDVFKYSYSHLAHVFKEQIGMSLFQYYDKKRFDRAVELLRSGATRITEIADRLQYQSVNAFSKAFSKKFGISPSEYLTSYQSSKSYNPQYDQVKKLLSSEGGTQNDCIQGGLFFCGGSCLQSIVRSPSLEELEADQFSRGAGHLVADVDDPIYD